MTAKKTSRAGGRPPLGDKTKPVAFRLPPALTDRVTEAAAREGLSRNKYVELVLRRVAGETPPTATKEVQYDLFG